MGVKFRNFLFIKMKQIRLMDWLILIVCFITMIVAGYDLYTIGQVESRCLDDCNDYWQGFVEENCPQYTGNSMVPTLLNYTY